jgi:hypothetical protein
LIRFPIRVRNDTLWTPARKATIFKKEGPSPSCMRVNKRLCDLLHILNNCAFNMKKMTVRYNMIQKILVNAVRKHRKLRADEIWANKEIDFGRFKKETDESILGEEAKQRLGI